MEASNGRGSSSGQFGHLEFEFDSKHLEHAFQKLELHHSYLEYRIAGNIKFDGGVSGPFIKEHCHLSLEVLEQSHEFANLNWQCVSAGLNTLS